MFIEENYVSFKIAKLLKEKGFNGLCTAYYDCFTTDNFHCGNEPTDFNGIDTNIRDIVSAPTLQMTMKWLRERNIFIEVFIPSHSEHEDDVYHDTYSFDIFDLHVKKYKYCSYSEIEYQTYEEACEAAIKYCLENLI